MTLTASPPGISRAALTAAFFGTFLAILDTAIVNVGLAAMQQSLSASFTQLQWIVDGFALSLAALLLTGGLLGDRFGRKRVYLGGVALFLASSLLCAVAPTIDVLIAGRVVQGIAAAIMMPVALAIVGRSTTDRAVRARRFGIYGVVVSFGFVSGPLLGGLLVDTLGWRSLFLVNLPIGALILILGVRGLTESADPEHAHLDVPGQTFAALFLGALVFATIEYREYGWHSATTWLVSVLCLAALIGLILIERRSRQPMLPVALFRDPRFTVTILGAAALGFAAGGSMYLLSLYLQGERGNSATATGLLMLPLTVAAGVGSYLAGRLTAAYAAWVPMSIGFTSLGIGLLGMLTADAGTSYALIAICFVLNGLGQGLSITPASAAVLEIAPLERAGIASATVSSARGGGTAVGIAVLGALTVHGLLSGLLVAGVTILAAAVLLVLFVGRAQR
ncbi:MFS transporter [Kribbella sandramycini]|uniref:EmrB/QacA subfamily drug resistance transporter n=1 Tax=Kribbella sandramycini TaxID=60450 RepID=A0A7Y4L1T6_9ACTN|nr:MFS transporter [Kribbella sandramycini]MBB6565433.1 EmrB/QacA subfamily drug resistance transporter [Kribbella sandramycini]NOL41701.1 MFS transporter [Kribbella sandramycini]